MAKTKTGATAPETELSDDDKAEQILREVVSEDRQLTFEEARFLQTRLGWSDTEQRTQRSRVSRVMQKQAIVGKSSDRAALASTLQKATETLEEKRPQLEEQIRMAQADLAELERDKHQLEKRTNDVEVGLQTLTEHAPPHVVAKADHIRRCVKQTLGREVNELRQEVNQLEVLIDPTRFDSPQRHVEAVRLYDRQHVIEKTSNSVLTYHLAPTWAAHAKQLAKALPKKKAQLEALEAELERELEEAKRPLQIYWR